MKKENLIGKRYGRLVVVSECESSKNGHAKWLCKCDCGNYTEVFANSLKRNLTKSCGCTRIEKSHGKNRTKDISGKKFNMLTVIKPCGKSKKGETIWECICDCGKTTRLRSSVITKGRTKSCGCLQGTISNREKINYPYGKDSASYKHGLHKTRLYNIWATMKKRCYNTKDEHYANYGGRGITVCDEWIHDFQAFYDWAMAYGYADDLTIDRINNDGNYEPSNCRWTTSKEQANNRRTTMHITVNGVTKNATDWAKMIGVGRSTISRHKKQGDIEDYISSRLRKEL